MKKGLLKVVTAGLVVASSAGLVACATETEDELKYSIYNYDNTYTINETFSLSGAKLKITNKDGSETEITISILLHPISHFSEDSLRLLGNIPLCIGTYIK